MSNRNGMDELARAINIVALIFVLISLFSKINIFLFIAIALIVYTFFRMLSKNIDKRQAENFRYLDFMDDLADKFKGRKSGTKDSAYRYFKCPQCKKALRVPKGKGKISIHCPQCGNDFIKRT